MVDTTFVGRSVARYSILWAGAVSAALYLLLPESWVLFAFIGGILCIMLGFASDKGSLDRSVDSISKSSKVAVGLAGHEVQISGSAQSPSMKALFFGLGLLTIGLGSVIITMIFL